jgi:membrane-bound ClpP family serine protease
MAHPVFCNLLLSVLTTLFLLMGTAGVAAQEAGQPAKPDEPAARSADQGGGKPVPKAGAAQGQERVGRLLRIPAPITSSVDARIRRVTKKVIADAKRNDQWPVLIFEFEGGPGSDFGKAYDLADYIASLTGATTVAYVPKAVKGHAVLCVMACDQVVMAEDAQIGEAGRDEESISPGKRSMYVDIANRRRTIPADLALGMLDKELEVWEVETDVAREFVESSRLEELRKQKTFQLPPKPLIPKGEMGLFSGREARTLDIADYLAADRHAVAKALELPRDAVEDDPSADGAWITMQVQLKGPITPQMISQTQRIIEEGIHQRNVNFICLWIESPGGSAENSLKLANQLADLDQGSQRTVAYIPRQALADAAFIALACDHIVMHPEATLGGVGAGNISEESLDLMVQSIQHVAEKKNRSPSLAAAMVDPKQVVYRYTRATDGAVEFMSEVEARAKADADQWKQGEEITRGNRLLSVDGHQAVEYGIAEDVVENFEEFKRLYGLEQDPQLVAPNWADTLIDALRSPGVAWFLLLLGGAALYAELQSPGLGVGAFISAVCFLLFFWSNYLGGTAGWLEILLFALGVACLLLELFVLPGFGIFGLGGAALIVVSIVLATQTFVFLPRNEYEMGELQTGLMIVAGAGVGLVGVISLIHRYLPHTPMLNRVVLAPPSEDETAEISRRESVASYEHLVGSHGTTVTQLTPAGKARIGNELVSVIADGEVIERGREIVVVEARGNRVVVKAV